MLIQESVSLPRARVLVHHERAYDFDAKRGLWRYKTEGEDEVAFNLITNTGRVRIHAQVYGTSGLLTNGFNWIALSNDATVPSASDTALASEVTGSGLDRVQGVVTLAAGSSNQTSIVYTFTNLGGGAQTVQKTALFTQAGPPPAGVMNHEIAFSPRTLYPNDTLALTFTIVLG